MAANTAPAPLPINGEMSDATNTATETPSDHCHSCQQLREELNGYKKEHAFYSDLKKKIALTDALIRRYSSKCQEFDLQQKKVEELTHKLASSKRDCKLLEEQLAKTLKEIIPWKREKTKFMEEYEDNKRKLMAAQDALLANQAGSQQYRIQINEMEKTLKMLKKEATEGKIKAKNLQAALDKRRCNVDDHKSELAQLRREKRNMASSFEKAKATVLRLKNVLIEHNISVPRISCHFLPKETAGAQEEAAADSDVSMESVDNIPEADKPQDADLPYVRKLQDILSRKEAEDDTPPSKSKQGFQEEKNNDDSSSDDNLSGAEIMSHVADEIDAQLNLTESKDNMRIEKSLPSARITTGKQGNSATEMPRLQTKNTILAKMAKEWTSPTRIARKNEKQMVKQTLPTRPVQELQQSKDGSSGRNLPEKHGNVQDRNVGLQRQLSRPDKGEKVPPSKKEKLACSDNDSADSGGTKTSVASHTRFQSQSGRSSAEKPPGSNSTMSKTSTDKSQSDITKNKPVRSISPRTRRQSQVGQISSRTLSSKERHQIKKEKTSTESDTSEEEGVRRTPPRTRSQSQSGQSGAEKTPPKKTKVLVKKRSKVGLSLSDTSDDDSPRPRMQSHRVRGKEKPPSKKERVQGRKGKPKLSLSDSSDEDWQPSETEVGTYSKETDMHTTKQEKSVSQKIRLSEESDDELGKDQTPPSSKVMPRKRRNTDTEIEVKRYPRRSRRLPRRYENEANSGDCAVREFYSDGDKPLDMKHGRIFDTGDANGKDVKKAKKLHDSSEGSGDEVINSLEKTSSTNSQEKVASKRKTVSKVTSLVEKEPVRAITSGKGRESEKTTGEGSRDESKQASEETSNSVEGRGKGFCHKILTRSHSSESSDDNKNATPDRLHENDTTETASNQEVKPSIKAEDLMLSPENSVFRKKFLKPISPVRSSPRKRHKSTSSGDETPSRDVRTNPFFPERVTRSSIQNLSAIFTLSRSISSSEGSSKDLAGDEGNKDDSVGLQTRSTTNVNSDANSSSANYSSGVKTRSQSQSSDQGVSDTKGDQKKDVQDTKDVAHLPKESQTTASDANKSVMSQRVTRSMKQPSSNTESKTKSSVEITVNKDSAGKTTKALESSPMSEDIGVKNVKDEVKFAEPIPTRTYYSRRRTRSMSSESSSSDAAKQSDFLDRDSVQGTSESNSSEPTKRRTRSMSAKESAEKPIRITRSMSEPRKRDVTKIKNEFVGQPKITAKSMPDTASTRRVTRLQAVNAKLDKPTGRGRTPLSDASGKEANTSKKSEEDDTKKSTSVKRTKSKYENKDMRGDDRRVVKKQKSVDSDEAHASEYQSIDVHQANTSASASNTETQPGEGAEHACQPNASVETVAARTNTPSSARNNTASLPRRRPSNSPILEPFQNYAPVGERLSPLPEFFEERDAHRHLSPVSPLPEPFQNFDGDRSLSPLPISPSETPPPMERPLSALSLPDIPPLPPLITPLPPSPPRPGMTRNATSTTRMANQVRLVSPVITPPPVLPRAISPLPTPPMPDAISPIKEDDNTNSGSLQSHQRLNLIPSPRNFHAVAPRHALAVPPHPTGHLFQAARCLTTNFTNNDRDVAGPSGINTVNEQASKELDDTSLNSGKKNSDEINQKTTSELEEFVTGKASDSGSTKSVKRNSVSHVNKPDNVEDLSKSEQSNDNSIDSGSCVGLQTKEVDRSEMEKDIIQKREINDVAHETEGTEDEEKGSTGENDANDVEPAETKNKNSCDTENNVNEKNLQPCGLNEEGRIDAINVEKDESKDTVQLKEELVDDNKRKSKRVRPRKARQTKNDNKESATVKSSKPNSSKDDDQHDDDVDDSGPKPVTKRRGKTKPGSKPDGDTEQAKAKNFGANQRRQTRSTRHASSKTEDPLKQNTEPDYFKLGRNDNSSSRGTNPAERPRKAIKGKVETSRKPSEREFPKQGLVAETACSKTHAEPKTVDVQTKPSREREHPKEKPSQECSKSNISNKVASKPCSNLLATSKRTIIVIPATEIRVSGFKRSRSLSHHKKHVPEKDKAKTDNIAIQEKSDMVESTASSIPSASSVSVKASCSKAATKSSTVTSVSPTLASATPSIDTQGSASGHSCDNDSPDERTSTTEAQVAGDIHNIAAQTSESNGQNKTQVSANSSIGITQDNIKPSASEPYQSSSKPTLPEPRNNVSYAAQTSESKGRSKTQVSSNSSIGITQDNIKPSASEPDQSSSKPTLPEPRNNVSSAAQTSESKGRSKTQVSSNSSIGITQGNIKSSTSEPDQSSSKPTVPPESSDNISSGKQNAPVPKPRTTRKIGNLWGDIAKKQTQSEQDLIKVDQETEEAKKAVRESNALHQTPKVESTQGHKAAAKGGKHPTTPGVHEKTIARGEAKRGCTPLKKSNVPSAWADMAGKRDEQQEVCRRRRKIPAADKIPAKQQKCLESDTAGTSSTPPWLQETNEAHVQGTMDRIATYRMGTNAAKLVKRIVSNFQFNALDLLPVVYARFAASNTCTQPTLTPIEEKLITAVIDWTKKNDCTTLVDFLLACLRQVMDSPNQSFKKVGDKDKHRFAVQSTVCRIYTTLCLHTNNLQSARVFAYEVLRNDYPELDRLVLAIAATWPAVLCKQESVQVSPVGSVIEVVVMQRLAKMTQDEVAQKTQAAFCGSCGWSANKADTIANLTQQLITMMQDANVAQLIDETDSNPTLGQMAFELWKATELLAFSMGWEWTNNTLIREHLWPVLKKWTVGLRSDNGIKNGSACVVMKIIANVGILGLSNNKQSVAEVMKMLLAVLQQPSDIIPWCVQLFTADAILQLSASKPSQSYPILQKWCTTTSQTVPKSLSERIQVLGMWVSNKDPRRQSRKK